MEASSLHRSGPGFPRQAGRAGRQLGLRLLILLLCSGAWKHRGEQLLLLALLLLLLMIILLCDGAWKHRGDKLLLLALLLMLLILLLRGVASSHGGDQLLLFLLLLLQLLLILLLLLLLLLDRTNLSSCCSRSERGSSSRAWSRSRAFRISVACWCHASTILSMLSLLTW